jgi:PAS domain S-box-containing protein
MTRASRDTETEISAALRASEDKYRFLTESIPVQVWTAVPDGRLDYVSNQTAQYFGLTTEQLLADGWQNVVHPDDLALVIAKWTNALAEGVPYEVEFRLKSSGGGYDWHLGRAVPQRNSSGRIVGWFGTNTNIEAQLEQQRQVQNLLAELRERNQLLALEAAIGSALNGAESAGRALQDCAETVVQHLDAAFARVWTTNSAGTMLELQASAGQYTHLDGPHGRVPIGKFKIGQIASQRKAHFTNAVVGDPRVSDQTWARREGMVAFAGCPLLFGEQVIGVIAIFARHALSDATTSALGSVANALAQSLERFRAEARVRQSELWLATTLSSIGDGVIATDPQGKITFLNPVAASLTGWTQADAAGQPLDVVFPIVNERTRKAVESPVSMVQREGVTVGMPNHTVLLQRGGTEIPIDDSAAPIRDNNGDLTGVVLVFRDAGQKRSFELERARLLTQTQRAYRDAETARDDLHSLFMQAPAPICILRGPEHTFALANPAYLQLIGSRRAIVGMGIRQALPELEGQGFYEILDRVYETGERFVGQDLPAKLDRGGDGVGEDAFVTLVYEAFRGSDGQVAGIFVVAFDVTDAVHARQSLQASLDERNRLLSATEDARDKADLANRAKDEFLATASHELRTPLNAILGWARLLRNDRVDASVFGRGLETIERNAMAQVQLIEDILDGSRIIAGKLHLEIRATDLAAVVNAAVDAVRPAATAKNIGLTLALDPEASRIHGDPDRLQQVVWNLLNNALKFTPKGGNVEVRLDRFGMSIELCVRDDGQGIPLDFLPHVFDRFRQADGSTTRRSGGLGLGLALVRHLVEAHGGSARAESPGAGLGATFIVTLPVQAVFPEAIAASRPKSPEPVVQLARAVQPLIGVTVLAVDDEPDARDLVATLLRAQGAEVRVAGSVDDALHALKEHTPNVIVSDIGMPDKDGYMLIGTVRSLAGDVSRTSAIALTAYAREQDRRRALEAGFDSYIAKPVEPGVLVRLVSELAKRSVRV